MTRTFTRCIPRLCLLAVASTAWADLRLGTTLEIDDGATPGIAVDVVGNLHVVYQRDGRIYYRAGTSALQFGAAEEIPAPEGPADYNSFHVVADAAGNPHVAFEKDWAGSSTKGWYTNRIGGAWKPPIEALVAGSGNRVNYPRLFLYEQVAFLSAFGAGSGGTDADLGQIARISNLATAPAVDAHVNTNLWVPHSFADKSGRVRVVGRLGPAGHYLEEYDFALNLVGDRTKLSDIAPTGQQTAGALDGNDVLHAAFGTWYSESSPEDIAYTNTERLAQGKPNIALNVPGAYAADLDLFPVLAADPRFDVYLGYRDPGGEGRVTMVSGDVFLPPVTLAPSATAHMRWDLQLAAAPTGGVYAAWESNGRVYVRPIGEASTIPVSPSVVNPASATPPGSAPASSVSGVTGLSGITTVNPLLSSLSSGTPTTSTPAPPPVPLQYTTGGNSMETYAANYANNGSGGGGGGGGGGCWTASVAPRAGMGGEGTAGVFLAGLAVLFVARGLRRSRRVGPPALRPW